MQSNSIFRVSEEQVKKDYELAMKACGAIRRKFAEITEQVDNGAIAPDQQDAAWEQLVKITELYVEKRKQIKARRISGCITDLSDDGIDNAHTRELLKSYNDLVELTAKSLTAEEKGDAIDKLNLCIIDLTLAENKYFTTCKTEGNSPHQSNSHPVP
jgi:hypothetical protein